MFLKRLPEPEPDPDRQWLGATPAEQAAEFEAVTRRRWPLVLDDLAALLVLCSVSDPPLDLIWRKRYFEVCDG